MACDTSNVPYTKFGEGWPAPFGIVGLIFSRIQYPERLFVKINNKKESRKNMRF